ncbi:MAG: hypothetical protein GVY29_10080 [Spirochaetes bacterium]|jgi:hypothetical protein|nr:hypothetical protein [Spirochaetota bacterium]
MADNQAATLSHLQAVEAACAEASRAGTLVPAERVEEALEAAARAVEPEDERPCDCSSCDCGDYGDAAAVAAWDEADANAHTIRALKEDYR